jgi:hypothetical protein
MLAHAFHTPIKVIESGYLLVACVEIVPVPSALAPISHFTISSWPSK